MKLEVEMYVRTLHNGIAKILEIDSDNRYWDKYRIDKLDVFMKGYSWIRKQDIVKASYNILDLVEVGDYVNGVEIEQILDGKLWFDASDMRDCCIESSQIKSIVTKEQFEQISYKIGE